MMMMTKQGQEPHGVSGQLNVYVLDKDSPITGYGAHNRLLVFQDARQSARVTIREDIRGLPLSTEAQRQKVAAGYQRMHARGERLTFVESVRVDVFTVNHEYLVRR